MSESTDNQIPSRWLCPVCKLKLNYLVGSWCCDNQHRFDRAKEGYVNLLLAQHKNSKDPGDNKDMVLARRSFLAEDHYLPLAKQVATLLTEVLGQVREPINVYDAGCGEGYYLAKIKQQLNLAGLSINASASDISKPAIQKAAKKHPDIAYAVASSFNLPVQNTSQDALIQVFAPSSAAEILRILKPQGWWLSVDPAPDHLFALKQQVYDTPQKHQLDNTVPEGFSLVSQTRLSFTMHLTRLEQRQNLLMMTPFYWTISAEKKQLLLDNLNLVNTDFDIKLMQKKPE
ncbi:putative RNA methyltransferase [Paraglaciecola hydrolytica]|nr:methyltransferase domain-containing protein [Paraglaciecola hydrolytica]